jgi:hypothetical protein
VDVRSEENVSDVLTKSLPAKKFRELVRDLMGHDGEGHGTQRRGLLSNLCA